MSNTQRRLNIALTVDAATMEPGIQAGMARNREFAEETKRLNQEVANSKSIYQSVKDQGASAGTIAAYKREYEQIKALRNEKVGNARVMAQLQDNEFRATHSSLEIQLRDRQMYYAELRAAHQGNAAMLLQIDKSYAAEAKAIQNQMGGEGVGGKIMGRGGRHLIHAGMMVAGGGPVGEVLGQGLGAAHSAEMLGATAGVAGAAGVLVGSLYLLKASFDDVKERCKQAGEKMHQLSVESEKVVETHRAMVNATSHEERAAAANKEYKELQAKYDELSSKYQGEHSFTELDDKEKAELAGIQKQMGQWSKLAGEEGKQAEEENREQWKAQIHPEAAMDIYRKQIERAVTKKELGEGDATILMERKARELLGEKAEGGTFGDSVSHNQSLQQALLSGKAEPEKQTEELKRISELLEDLKKNGFRVKAA